VSFIWAPFLIFLLAIPVAVALAIRLERRRERRVAAYGGLAGPSLAMTNRPSGIRRRLPAVAIVIGLTLIVLALARPQAVLSVPRIEGTVILAFDVSGSMAADDLDPTRMEAAKAAARAFVERQPDTILIGVVAFSDSGFSIQRPTSDAGHVTAAIDRLAPERGTAIARGILTSLTAIASAEADPVLGYYSDRSPDPSPEPTPVPAGTYSSAVIVLLTDGENNQRPDPLEAAQAARDRGVRIYTVGIGTTAGSTLEVEGFRVHSRLDEATLQRISELTDGAYYAADEPDELSAVYDAVEARLVVRPEATELTSPIVGAGLLMILIGAVASLVWWGRLP
jgi:Ca-activated chloride channel homolog